MAASTNVCYLGASIHAEGSQGRTVLLHAALCQSRSAVRALLSEGAHVEDSKWHTLVEAAMELEPSRCLGALAQPRIATALRPLWHEALLQSRAERAQKAWTFIADLRLDTLVDPA